MFAIAIIASLLLVSVVLAVDILGAPSPNHLPGVRRQPGGGRYMLLDVLSTLAIVAVTAAGWYLPNLSGLAPELGGRARFALIAASSALLFLIALLEFMPAVHRKAVILHFSRVVVRVILWPLAVLAMSIPLLLIDTPLSTARNAIVAGLLFCGALTAYREWRRRWRTGDRSRASLLGGAKVVSQFLALVLVAAGFIAFGWTIILWAGSLIQSFQKAWFETTSLFVVLISIVYLVVYLTRRIIGARGFSWVDPPQWRTLFADVKYKQTLRLSGRLPFLHISTSGLADTVRMAYTRHIVAGDGELAHAIDEAARISPPRQSRCTVAFTILGDPGEGDDSQLYDVHRPEKQHKIDVLNRAASDNTQGGSPASKAGGAEGSQNVLSPDFVLVSSDVVYPAGELMDYERTVYRVYCGTSVPIYAIPGNHDWYDHLNAFFMNFSYAAVQQAQAGSSRAPDAGGRYFWVGGRQQWDEISKLRDAYDLHSLGGFVDDPTTQQRLPFFELCFLEAPLTVVGVDTGCTGSVDALQFRWLERRLRQARAQGHILLVVLSEPLYVDGKFAHKPVPGEPPADGSAGRQLWEVYALLRKYEVDVVMAGDTHAYQRYEVYYHTPDGRQRTMHHVVNGGSGAYLSLPMDFGWEIAWAAGSRLARRFVFQDAETHEYDDVVIRDLFPTAQQMLDKFMNPAEYASAQGGLAGLQARLRRWYSATMLRFGLTNALDHDTSPLLQSYVSAEFIQDPADSAHWTLTLTPWITTGEKNRAQPNLEQRVVIEVGCRQERGGQLASEHDK